MKSNEPKFLKSSQYKNDKNLSARFGLYDFSYPKVDIYNEAIKALKLKGNEKILEVGCGNGQVLVNIYKGGHRGELTGTDISKGMYKETVAQCKQDHLPIKFKEVSADKLPFKDESFDVILAFFMIYHMPDINIALQEWKRVLKPNGKLLVTIGSKVNLVNRRKLTTSLEEKTKSHKKRFIDAISYETAPKFLKKYFKIESKRLLKYNLRIPDETRILKAIESTKEFFEPKPSKQLWQQCMNEIKEKIKQKIKAKGYFTDTAHRGFYICSK